MRTVVWIMNIKLSVAQDCFKNICWQVGVHAAYNVADNVLGMRIVSRHLVAVWVSQSQTRFVIQLMKIDSFKRMIKHTNLINAAITTKN